jgi:hypothetical protein
MTSLSGPRLLLKERFVEGMLVRRKKGANQIMQHNMINDQGSVKE